MSKSAFEAIQQKFTSGNSVPVERAVVTADEWRQLQEEKNQAVSDAVRAARKSWVKQGDKPINEIRAEAVEKAAKECKMLFDGPNITSACLTYYAQQIREGKV